MLGKIFWSIKALNHDSGGEICLDINENVIFIWQLYFEFLKHQIWVYKIYLNKIFHGILFFGGIIFWHKVDHNNLSYDNRCGKFVFFFLWRLFYFIIINIPYKSSFLVPCPLSNWGTNMYEYVFLLIMCRSKLFTAKTLFTDMWAINVWFSHYE